MDDLLKLTRKEQIERPICNAILDNVALLKNDYTKVGSLSDDAIFEQTTAEDNPITYFFVGDKQGELIIEEFDALCRYHDFLLNGSDDSTFDANDKLVYISKDTMIDVYARFLARYAMSADESNFKFYETELFHVKDKKTYRYFGFGETEMLTGKFVIGLDRIIPDGFDPKILSRAQIKYIRDNSIVLLDYYNTTYNAIM